MVHGTPVTGVGAYLVVGLGQLLDRQKVVGAAFEFFNPGAADVYLGMGFEHLQLDFEAFGTGDVVGVHAGDEVVAAVADAFVQGVSQALVARQAHRAEQGAPLLVFPDGLCQDVGQGAVFHEDDFVGLTGLAQQAVEGFTQAGILFLGVDRQQHGKWNMV